ncbi:hypothetical protein C8F01DRAFT_1160229 [Mycena amicta]|nr:hypothetical protein C8F01DRAFT_1160229 [Mycena amicta]
MRLRIQQALGNRINVEPATITVVPPAPAPSGRDSVLWAVVNVHPTLIQTLLNDGVLSTDEVTLQITPPTLTHGDYLHTIDGTFFPINAAGAAEARPLLNDILRQDVGVRRAVAADRSAYPATLSEPEAFDRFCNSQRLFGVELLSNGLTRVVWNSYHDFPTASPEGVDRIRQAARSLFYSTPYHGTGYVHPGFHCLICHSIDHPTPLCPFPSTPNWRGPNATTIQALIDASRSEAEKQRKMLANNGVVFGNAPGPSNGNGGNGNNGPGNNGTRGNGRGRRGGRGGARGRRGGF